MGPWFTLTIQANRFPKSARGTIASHSTIHHPPNKWTAMNGISINVDRNATFDITARVNVSMGPPPGPLVKLSATCGGFISTHIGAMNMAYTLPADKKVLLQIAYVDSKGNPAQVDGAVVWD